MTTGARGFTGGAGDARRHLGRAPGAAAVGAGVSSSLAAALVREISGLPVEELAPLVDRLVEILGDRLSAPPLRPPSPWLTADEAAEVLRCRRRRVYELVRDGRLARHGDGRRLLLARADVERLAAGD
jgi:excisionase family DNA binding protein